MAPLWFVYHHAMCFDCAIVSGGLFGGVNGLYQGYRETASTALTGAVRRTQSVVFFINIYIVFGLTSL